MVLKTIVVPAALLAALAVAPAPADAQRRSGHSGGGSRATAAPRGVYGGSRGVYGGSRGVYGGSRGVYGGSRGVYGGSRGVYGGSRGYYGSRGFYGSRGYYGSRYGGFYSPYYAFRSRYSLGFGLFVGYPVSYPYYYGYPYGYAYPYEYGYPYASYEYPYSYPYPARSSGYQTQPQGYPPTANAVASGGVSFEITPSTAEVYVDGSFAGTVGEFSPSSQPLTLSPGRHHIEVRAPNFATMTFDTDVSAGQVVPYRGTMQRQ